MRHPSELPPDGKRAIRAGDLSEPFRPQMKLEGVGDASAVTHEAESDGVVGVVSVTTCQ